MANDHLIYVRKGDLKSQFTSTVWKNLGKNKEGWRIDPERNTGNIKTAPAKSPTVKKDLNTGERYKSLIAQAKGFETDGLWRKALDRYSKAYALKQTKALEKKFSTLEAKMADEMTKAVQKAAIEAADEAFVKKDFETAKELYLAVPIQTEYVTGRIEECETNSLA